MDVVSMRVNVYWFCSNENVVTKNVYKTYKFALPYIYFKKMYKQVVFN